MKSFDLFAGYGGFTLALEKVYEELGNKVRGTQSAEERKQDIGNGLCPESEQRNKPECIGFSEIDKYASAVLKYHWPNTKNYGDITKINWSEVPDFDLLTGGSPCQDLSIAGKRAGLEGSRSGLFYEYMRAVKEKKPKYFIWENVKGALSSNKGFDFLAVINEMAEAGYSLWWQVLNAKDFGVPQNRERIFVVGFRDRPAPEVFFERTCPEQNLRQIIGGSQGYRVYDTNGISVNIASQAGGVGAKTGLYIARVCRKEGIYKCKTTETSGSLTATMHKGIDASGRTGVIEGSRIRRLTPTECERLMGLPDGWTAKGIMNDKEVEISDSQRYKLCGNGVVINVVEEIIKNVICN